MSAFADGRFLAISVFLCFLTACLFLSLLGSPDLHEDTDDFLTERGGRRPFRQGLVLTGDFVSAAVVLHLCGLVATAGYDGFLVLTAAALSPLLLKVWLAERLPDGPGWSLGDVLARSLPAVPARRAAGFATLLVCVPLLTAQLVPVGHVTTALLGMPHGYGETAGIALVGILILACAAIGGARCSTRQQLVKTVGFLVLAGVLAAAVLAAHGWDHSALLRHAARSGPYGEGAHTAAALAPGSLFGPGLLGRLDTLGLAVTLLLGAAFLPHLVMRLATSGTPVAARRAASWSVVLSGLLLAAVAVIGYGLRAIVGVDGLDDAGPHGGSDLLLLAASFDGHGSVSFTSPAMVAFVACAAFLAVLASATVLLLAGAAAIVHDLDAARPARAAHQSTAPAPRRPVHARTALAVMGATSIALGAFCPAGVSFWLTLALTVAATAVLPALVCALLWPGFSRRGLTWSVYGGTTLALALLALSPSVSGSPDALFPGADWALFPLHTPALVSVPAAFALAWAGSLRDRAAEPAPEPAPEAGPEPAAAPGPGPRSA